jgi:hypothetical protein
MQNSKLRELKKFNNYIYRPEAHRLRLRQVLAFFALTLTAPSNWKKELDTKSGFACASRYPKDLVVKDTFFYIKWFRP